MADQMPADVVEVARHVAAQLLEGDSPGDTWVAPHRVLTAAADEIERLRAGLLKVTNVPIVDLGRHVRAVLDG